MQFGLTAPTSLPVGATDELALSRAEEGMLAFERIPELVDRQSLQMLGYTLVRRSAEHAPHASATPAPVATTSYAQEL